MSFYTVNVNYKSLKTKVLKDRDVKKVTEKKVWIRPATGLVRTFSTFDMHADDVTEKIDTLLGYIDEEPKTVSWRLRAKIGTEKNGTKKWMICVKKDSENLK